MQLSSAELFMTENRLVENEEVKNGNVFGHNMSFNIIS